MPGRPPPRSRARGIAGSFVWMISAASLACGDAADGSGTASRASVRDSAGVEIVENSIPGDAGAAIVTADTPSLVIGAVEGDESQQLHRVHDALRLPDERIAVLNAGSHEVRIYGADGSLDVAFGRQGDGPSEFAGFPYQLELLPPDTLVIWDIRTWETSWFLADGTFLRKEPGRTEYEAHVPEGRRAEGGYAVPGKGLLLRIHDFGAQRPEGEVYVPSMELTFFAGEGELRNLGDFGGSEQVASHAPGRPTSAMIPFATSGITAFGGRPARVWAGRNDRYELRQFTGDGRLERIVRADRTARAVTSEQVDRWIAGMRDAMIDGGAPPDIIEWQVEALEGAPAREFMPVFDGVHVTVDGGAWVRRSAGADAWVRGRPVRYDVFGPDGRWRGLAEMTRPVSPIEIGDDYLLGVRRNDLSVEFVELYELETATPAD